MFRLNLKIALRNIWKNKSTLFINVTSLALGLTGFIIILLYINKETSYDKWSPELKRVYQIGIKFKADNVDEAWQTMPYSLVKLVREKAPEIESITGAGWNGGLIKNGQDFFYDINVMQADSSFFNSFPFELIVGDVNKALHQPNTAVINKKTAMKVFGTDQVVGRTINIGKENTNTLITGVWDETMNPSHFTADVLIQLPVPTSEHWGNFTYLLYFKIKDGVDHKIALAKVNRLFLDAKARWSKKDSKSVLKPDLLTEDEANKILGEDGSSMQVIFEPVGKIHLDSQFQGKSKGATIYVLSGLGIFLLTIACINFTNLTIAHASKRATEIGVKKVLGMEKRGLVKQFLFETLLQTTFAFLVGLALVELLLPYFNSVLGTSISFMGAARLSYLLFQVLIVFVIVTLSAGLYPAVYFSGFLPAKVLKGNFERSASGALVKKVLVISQFVITCTFIICFAIMYHQLNYMKTRDLGMQKGQVLSITLQGDKLNQMPADQFEQVRQRIKNIDGITEVTRTNNDPWTGEVPTGDAQFADNKTMITDYFIDFDYFKTLGIHLKSGRDFTRQAYHADSVGNAILNEAAVKAFGLKDPIGKIYTRSGMPRKIIGVVKDFNDSGFEKEVRPMHFFISQNWTNYNNVLVRVKGDQPQQTLTELEAIWKTLEPDFPIRYKWVDESFAKTITSYSQQGQLMYIFSIATLVVALSGLFALATYNAKTRTREIAVRKVLGASTTGILRLLNKEFVMLVVIANGIAFIGAYILMNKWLSGFAYRIDMPYLTFLATAMVSISLTVLTVSYQAYRAAIMSPVNALKHN
ncbi:MAG: ABC transporter permease [Pedobacter sp.]|nr:MAG: ABC transporter permease [Pedobacter sp.]